MKIELDERELMVLGVLLAHVGGSGPMRAVCSGITDKVYNAWKENELDKLDDELDEDAHLEQIMAFAGRTGFKLNVDQTVFKLNVDQTVDASFEFGVGQDEDTASTTDHEFTD